MVLSCFALNSRRYEQVRLAGFTNEVQVLVSNGGEDEDDRNFLQLLLVGLTGCVRTVVETDLLLLLCLTVLQLKVMSRISPSTLSLAALLLYAAAPLWVNTTF